LNLCRVVNLIRQTNFRPRHFGISSFVSTISIRDYETNTNGVSFARCASALLDHPLKLQLLFENFPSSHLRFSLTDLEMRISCVTYCIIIHVQKACVASFFFLFRKDSRDCISIAILPSRSLILKREVKRDAFINLQGNRGKRWIFGNYVRVIAFRCFNYALHPEQNPRTLPIILSTRGPKHLALSSQKTRPCEICRGV